MSLLKKIIFIALLITLMALAQSYYYNAGRQAVWRAMASPSTSWRFARWCEDGRGNRWAPRLSGVCADDDRE